MPLTSSLSGIWSYPSQLLILIYVIASVTLNGDIGWSKYTTGRVESVLILFFSALTYNFGETKKNPDKVRQKYLDQFFGPTAIAGSALRAFRNPFFAIFFRTWYDLIFHTQNMTQIISKAHLNTWRDTILSEPWLHAKIFRDVCSFFFTSIGWVTYYVW